MNPPPWRLAAATLGLGLCAAWLIALPGLLPRVERRVEAVSSSAIEPAPRGRPGLDPARLYELEVRPLLAASAVRQEQAVQRSLAALRSQFDEVRQRLPLFSAALTSLPTQARVLGLLAREQFGEPGQVQALIAERFERHLFSAEELAEWIDHALWDAEQAFLAEQNRLLRDVAQLVSAAGLPSFEAPDTGPLLESGVRALEGQALHSAQASAWRGLGALVLGTVGAEMAGRGAARLVLGLGGRAAAGALGGAGGAAWAGPVASGAGFLVGLGVGLCIDAWMSQQSRREIEARLSVLLDEIEQRLLVGDGSSPGLEPRLRAHLQHLQAAQSGLVRGALHL